MNNFSKQWMEDICTELNKAGFQMPDFKGGGSFEINRLENPIDLMKTYITYSAGMYEHLNSKGLINRGYCPITGEQIGTAHFYEFFGRVVYISEEGKRKATEWDRKEHIRVFGKEPMTESQKRENYENFRHEKQSAKTMTILFLLLIFFGIIYLIKKC
jgi:hypothetical protein